MSDDLKFKYRTELPSLYTKSGLRIFKVLFLNTTPNNEIYLGFFYNKKAYSVIPWRNMFAIEFNCLFFFIIFASKIISELYYLRI